MNLLCCCWIEGCIAFSLGGKPGSVGVQGVGLHFLGGMAGSIVTCPVGGNSHSTMMMLTKLTADILTRPCAV